MEYSDELRSLDRKRGRPVGKGRVPLSVEERRARNAQYERERRIETAEAMSDLAAALGCETTTSNADVLATAVQILRMMQQSNDPSSDIAELKRSNASLMKQVEEIENRLASCENHFDNQRKKEMRNGGVKKRKESKQKRKRHTRAVLRPLPQQEAARLDPTTDTHSTDENAHVAMTDTVEEPLSFDSIPDCPMDWGIDHLIADYML